MNKSTILIKRDTFHAISLCCRECSCFSWKDIYHWYLKLQTTGNENVKMRVYRGELLDVSYKILNFQHLAAKILTRR